MGLSGIAAALTGRPRSVLLTDIDPIAVELSRLGAERSGVGGLCRCAVGDWAQLDEWPSARFDVAVAADVIYEPEACTLIAQLLGRILSPGGRFLLADGKARRNRSILWEGLTANGAFELTDERWVEVGGQESAVEVPGRQHVGDDERTPPPSQQVLLATFVKTVGEDCVGHSEEART